MHLFPVSTNGGPATCSSPHADTRTPRDRAPRAMPLQPPRCNPRVVLLVVAVALGGQLASQFTVAWGTDAAAETDAKSRMALGFRLFESATAAAQSRLSAIAGDLSRDRAARGALASGSRSVADGVLKAALVRSGVIHGALLAADGAVVAAALPHGELDMAPLLHRARQHGALRTAAVIADRAYLLAMEPVARPGVAAWALAVEALDPALTAARAAGVSLRVAGKPGVKLVASGESGATPHRMHRTLATPTGALHLVAERDVKEAAWPFVSMRLALATVGVLAVLAALLVGLAIARTRQGAITELLQAVARIRHGDYGRPPAVEAGTDLAVLARSFVRMQSSIAGREARIAQQARQDALAVLASRDEAHARVEEAIHTAGASRTPVTLIALGVAGFEALCASLDPTAIEDLLGELARRLASEARVADRVARLERADFLVVLRDTDVEGGTVMARRLAGACSRAVPLEGGAVALDLAAGIAVYPAHGDDARALITRASRALRVAELIPDRVHAHEATPEESVPLRTSA